MLVVYQHGNEIFACEELTADIVPVSLVENVPPRPSQDESVGLNADQTCRDKRLCEVLTNEAAVTGEFEFSRL